MSDTPEQLPTIFGIDLGTTYSCIAYVDEYGKATVIPNGEGDLTTPSVVLFEGENRVVGKEAKNAAVLNPTAVVEMVKRQMGQPGYIFDHDGTDYRAEEISAYILRKVVGDAATQLGRPITDVVITCPAYFGIEEREATRKAGELAGLNVKSILNEPTAAAIDFGIQNEGNQTVMVYDLGGGTFDVTIIRISEHAIEVVATGGDRQLGGRDWDEKLVRYLASQWIEQTGSSANPMDEPATEQDLWQKAETAKRSLSARAETRVNVVHAGQPETVTITREKFDELTGDLLEKTIAFTKSTLDDARKQGCESFDQILLVGGSTRMLQVKERLVREFNMEPKVHDPDQSVAKGAALYGQKLMLGERITEIVANSEATTPDQVDLTKTNPTTLENATKQAAEEFGFRLRAAIKARDLSIRNVASHSFGVIVLDATERDVISNLVRRNTPVPVQNVKTYYTVEAEQDTVLLRITENDFDEDVVPNAEEGVEIGTATLELPPHLPAHAPIEVTCELDDQGQLHVIGREPSSNARVEATVDTKGSMTPDEVEAAKRRQSQVVLV